MPDWHQAIILANTGKLLIGPLGTNFSEIWKMSSGKWRPFCLSLRSIQTLNLNQRWFTLINHSSFWFFLMMTSLNGNIFRVTGHLCGEFTVPGQFPPIQRPMTRSFDVFFDQRLNKWLSKQSWGWWFETPSCSLWHHCNVEDSQLKILKMIVCTFCPQSLMEDLQEVAYRLWCTGNETRSLLFPHT